MATNMRRILFSVVQKRFLITGVPSSASAAASTFSSKSTSLSSSSFTVQFLIKSCGLSSKSALSASQKLQLDEKSIRKAKSVLQLFKSHNFDDTHIVKLIEKWPTVLHCKVQGNLKPKFVFLAENGFSGELLPQLVVANPAILKRSLDSQIRPCFQLFKSFLQSNDDVMVVLKRNSWWLPNAGAIQPAIDFLINEGIPVDNVKKLIIGQPETILYTHERMIYAVNYLKNLGLRPQDAVFMDALHVIVGLSASTRKKKFEVMKSLGWNEEEILGMFKRFPRILKYSEKKISGAMDFLMNSMGLEQKILFTYPYLLGFSIEKRIHPRYKVIKVLELKGLLNKEDKKIAVLLMITDKKFSENYVAKYADKVPGLQEMYGSSGKAKKTSIRCQRHPLDAK